MGVDQNSIWNLHNKLPSFPTLNKNEQTEVLIVGGGITGLLTAYELINIGLKVMVIDASTLCSGTTGRTTAKISAQHGILYDSIIKSSGVEQARQYYTAAMDGKDRILNILEELKMDIDIEQKDSVIYTEYDENIQAIEDEFRAYDTLNIPGKYTESTELPVETKAAVTMFHQAQFDPLLYIKQIIDASIKQGLEVYEHTQAIDIEHGNEIKVTTDNGHDIHCTYVVQATHFPFFDPLGMFTTRLIPERSFIYAGKNENPHLKGMHLSNDTPARSIRTAKINNEHAILIGGEGYVVGKNKSSADPYKQLKQTAYTLFPDHTFITQWSAQDYNTMDSIPYIGRLKNKYENIFVATGFKKWGMTTSATAALLIKDLIQKRQNPNENLFSPSRFELTSSVPTFVKQNSHVATQLIKGKVSDEGKSIDELKANDATTLFKKGKKLGVYKDEQEEVHVVDTTCTHLGCEVEWNTYDLTWDCPCHGSRFTYTGKVIEGPAKKHLKKEEL